MEKSSREASLTAYASRLSSLDRPNAWRLVYDHSLHIIPNGDFLELIHCVRTLRGASVARELCSSGSEKPTHRR